MSKLEAPQFGGQNGSNIGSNEMSSLSAGAGFCPKNGPHSQHSQNRTTTKKNQIQYLFVHAPRGFFPGFPPLPLSFLMATWRSLNIRSFAKKTWCIEAAPSVPKCLNQVGLGSRSAEAPAPFFFINTFEEELNLNIGYFTKKTTKGQGSRWDRRDNKSYNYTISCTSWLVFNGTTNRYSWTLV